MSTNITECYFAENQERQKAKKELLQNQSDYYKTAKDRNVEWKKVATIKNNALLSQVKGKVKGKTIKSWKSVDSVDGVGHTRNDFMQIISNVKTVDDPIFNNLTELLSGLEEFDHFDVLSEYVKEIFAVCEANNDNNE